MTMFYRMRNAVCPVVVFEFTSEPITDADFGCFLNEWEELHTRPSPFTLIFDTTRMAIPHPKYCIKMAQFIKKIRRIEPQRLTRSVIVVQNQTIATLLELVFYLQPPVAPVYLTCETDVGLVEAELGKKNEEDEKEEDGCQFSFKVTNVIRPGKAMLPFL